MISALFFCLLSFAPDETLVLKNGKRIQCLRYEITGATLVIYTEDKTFSVPDRLVDWDATEAFREASKEKERQQLIAREEAEKEQVEEENAPPFPVELYERAAPTMVLTNDQYHNKVKSNRKLLSFTKWRDYEFVKGVFQFGHHGEHFDLVDRSPVTVLKGGYYGNTYHLTGREAYVDLGNGRVLCREAILPNFGPYGQVRVKMFSVLILKNQWEIPGYSNILGRDFTQYLSFHRTDRYGSTHQYYYDPPRSPDVALSPLTIQKGIQKRTWLKSLYRAKTAYERLLLKPHLLLKARERKRQLHGLSPIFDELPYQHEVMNKVYEMTLKISYGGIAGDHAELEENFLSCYPSLNALMIQAIGYGNTVKRTLENPDFNQAKLDVLIAAYEKFQISYDGLKSCFQFSSD